MPLYRFHVRNDIDAPDDEGENLHNLAAAHLKAIDYARDLASAAVRQGRLDRKHRIDVEDEDGKVLVTVTFAEAVEVLN
jgi:ATP-dependent 26S proteasome regulatory subunit